MRDGSRLLSRWRLPPAAAPGPPLRGKDLEVKGRHQVGRGRRDQMGVGGAPLSWSPGLASHAPDSALGLSALVVLTSSVIKNKKGKKTSPRGRQQPTPAPEE